MSEQIETLFVLSVIGEKGSPGRDRSDEVLELVIRPACESVGLRALRADEDLKPGTITTSIVRHIVEARVVVADMTGRNPNVFYELGIADTLKKPVILLAASVEEIPFDKRHERTIVIGDEGVLGARQAQDALKQLTQTLRLVLHEDYQVANVVTEANVQATLQSAGEENSLATELVRLSDRVEQLDAKFAELATSLHTLDSDHETRLTRIEVTLTRLRPVVETMSATLPMQPQRAARSLAANAAEAAGSKKKTADIDEEPF